MAKVKFTYRVPRGLITPESRMLDIDRTIDQPVPQPQPVPRSAPPTRVDVPIDEPDLEQQRMVDRWWHESSFDLRCGLDVVEDTTVPGELMDDLFSDYKSKSPPRGR